MKNHLAILATLLVFGWLAVDKSLLRPPPAIADAYHAEVVEAAEGLPRHFGPWLGTDVPVPTAAVRMLKPNVIISRQFQNIQTGESVSFLLVHVRDARDILGHYPPVCYPGQGWKLDAATPMDWESGPAAVSGTRYHFQRDVLFGQSRLVIDNFLLLSDGTTCRDMDGVEKAAQDRLRKLFGAAQVQLVYSGAMSEERQRQVTQEFINYSEHAIAVISSGEQHVTK